MEVGGVGLRDQRTEARKQRKSTHTDFHAGANDGTTRLCVRVVCKHHITTTSICLPPPNNPKPIQASLNPLVRMCSQSHVITFSSAV